LQVNSHLKTIFNLQSIAQEELQRTFQGCLTFYYYQSSLSHYGSNTSKIKPKFHRTLEAVDSFRSANFHHVQSKDTRLVRIPKGCDLCSKKNHPVCICPRFLQMTVEDRLAYIQRKQFCSNFFASTHQFRDCISAHNCLTCQDRGRMFTSKGRLISGVRVERQFYPDDYISRGLTAVRSPSPSLP